MAHRGGPRQRACAEKWVRCRRSLGDTRRVDQAAQIVAMLREVVGADVIGAYLHGSSVMGGLRPASDLDVLVVSQTPLDHSQRADLLGGLLGISGSVNRGRPVELVLVDQSEVSPWRYPPAADFHYGEWRRSAYEAGDVPAAHPMPDLALVIAMTVAGDRPLAGPPPAHVLDPVPRTDVVRASVAGLDGLVADLDGDTRNVLLTLARVWSTLATGRIRSKDAAATWVLPRLPARHRLPIEHSRRLYLTCTYAQESWSAEQRSQVRPCAARMLTEIDRLLHHPERTATS